MGRPIADLHPARERRHCIFLFFCILVGWKFGENDLLTDSPNIYIPNPSIVLVEDDPADQVLASRILGKNRPDETVHILRDGAEAIDFFFKREFGGKQPFTPPKLILLDLKLPKVDGFEVLGRIKADLLLRSVPVVVFSSSDDPGDIARCTALGAEAYTKKPSSYEEYSEAVERICNRWLPSTLSE